MSAAVRPAVVVDSSALVALLTEGGEVGDWVTGAVDEAALAAPHLAVFEAANILRRQQLRGDIDVTEATLAHRDLLDLGVQLWPYAAIAERAWQLRDNLTLYDASYVALAESLDATLVTLDGRLSRATGIACPISSPPAASR